MAKPKTKEAERESMRKAQLKMLQSDKLIDLYVAGVTRVGTNEYGEVGKQAGHRAYINALTNPDEYVSKLMANEYIQAEEKSEEMYGGASSAQGLLKNAQAFYQSAIAQVKVKDLLELMGIKNKPKNVDAKDYESYIVDIQESNKKLSGIVVGTYLNSLVMERLGKSMDESAKGARKNLEQILNEEPEPKQKGNREGE